MKTYNKIVCVSLCLAFISCTQNSPKDVVSNPIDSNTLRPKAAEVVKTVPEFNLEQIPISTIDLGDFPYLTAPDKYKYSGDIQRQLEEKYFFYNDSLVRKVNGEYFHTTIFPKGDAFEDTFVVSEYTKAIEKLGGVELYSGGLPVVAAELIDKEKPAYVSDMYDPRAYKYKQFLIRTSNTNIWVELCHGLNARQIDFTVIKEL